MLRIWPCAALSSIYIPVHEVEALKHTLRVRLWSRLKVCSSSVKLTSGLPLRLEWIRSDESDESAHCSEALSGSHKLIYLHSPEI